VVSAVNKRIDVIEKVVTIHRKNISFVTFILEGYEGWSIATTIDKTRAIVKLFIMADFMTEMEGLMESLGLEPETKERIPAAE
jgi:hypothetical protein